LIRLAEAHDGPSGARGLTTAVTTAAAAVSGRAGYSAAKRLLDVLGSAILLLVLAPMMALIALAVWADGRRGPVLYCHARVGQDGRCFRFYKFRSMVVGADGLKQRLCAQNEATGPIFKMRHDPRVTRVGRVLRRYSLDELPQLFNVLRGDMSLVGPRPHLPREVESYLPHQHRRLCVRPGLLCLREVSGRSELTFERWMELDLEYVDRRSFLLDLSILMRAVPAVLRGTGAY
jgi:lipopolysaccharide/colanic/teichoic acid biosynthesis glycosyltransferase